MSGYCSIGISKTWVGDIREGSKLREMLLNVAFQNEIIISAGTYAGFHDPYAELLLQLHQNVLNMGFAHFAFVSGDNQSTCKQLQSESNSISCVYDSGEQGDQNLPKWTFLEDWRGLSQNSWHERLRFVARAIRLGYNVMQVDADSIFFTDPYIHFKSPPFKRTHYLCNLEGGGTFFCNSGFVKPDGPVSWIFMDAVRQALLPVDDHFNGVGVNGWTTLITKASSI